jgi:hypothetical protein
MKQSYGRLLAARLMSPAAGIGLAAAAVAGLAACHNNNSTPCPNLSQATTVLGQPDFFTGTAPGTAGISATTMAPTGNVAIGEVSGTTYLYIADGADNRVLVYEGVPTTSGAGANFAIGQACMTVADTNPTQSSTDCGGAPAPAVSLRNPSKVSVSDTGQLVVTDTGNNRVLIWETLPTSNQTAPDLVVGQSSLTVVTSPAAGTNPNNECNYGGETAYTLCAPSAAVISNNNLIVADQSNNRVLIWNGVPAAGTNGAPADIELGQLIVFDGVTCSSNISTTTSTGSDGKAVPANFCFTNNTPGEGDVYISATQQYDMFFNHPTDAWTDGTRLLVSDTNTNRVLYYSTIPNNVGQQNPQPITLVGVSTFDTGYGTPGSGSQKFNTPTGVWSDGTNVFVADTNNNRVLEFPLQEIISGNLAAAQEVFGQEDFSHVTQNDPDQNGQVGDQRNNPPTIGPVDGTLWGPNGVYSSALSTGNVFVTDATNYRLLIYPADAGVNGTYPNLCS